MADKFREDFDYYLLGSHDHENYKHSDDKSHYIVECSFTNDRWRFEMEQVELIPHLLPLLVKPTVHLVGEVIDVTANFAR